MSAFRDLRHYIDHLTEALGKDEVLQIDGADRDLDIGGITELLAERKAPP